MMAFKRSSPRSSSYTLFSKAGRSQAGMTLIEVLIATIVVGVVLTAIAGVLTNSVKNAAQSRYRGQATDLAQSAMEVFTREKTLQGWGEFEAFFPANSTTPYCMVSLPDAGQLKSLHQGACTTGQVTNVAGASFMTQAQATRSTLKPGEVDISVTTQWDDGSRSPQVLLTKAFRKTD